MLSPLTNLDLLALAWFAISIFGYQFVSGLPLLASRSVAAAVQRRRVQWMQNMADRENRMMDAMVLQALSQGNAFFASTSAIGIGGLSALLGAGERTQAILEQLPYVVKSSPGLWEIKILLMMGIFIFAFFKFAWAFRLSHYTGIMIGATPIGTASNEPDRDRHAERSAELIGIAADHANSGLRSFYYAIAALGWFFHPLAFIVATTWVLAILIRRDFFSRSRRILSGA